MLTRSTKHCMWYTERIWSWTNGSFLVGVWTNTLYRGVRQKWGSKDIQKMEQKPNRCLYIDLHLVSLGWIVFIQFSDQLIWPPHSFPDRNSDISFWSNAPRLRHKVRARETSPGHPYYLISSWWILAIQTRDVLQSDEFDGWRKGAKPSTLRP